MYSYQSIPEGIHRYHQLLHLHASYNEIVNLLPEIFNHPTAFSSLYSLDLSSNKMESISFQHFTAFKSLSEVILHSNCLKIFPPSLEFVTTVRRDRPPPPPLQISKSPHSALAQSFQSLTQSPLESFFTPLQIRDLRLSFNSITELPEVISNLGRLRQFSAGENQLSRLPKTFGSSLFQPTLMELKLENNQLCELPSDFENLSSIIVCLPPSLPPSFPPSFSVYSNLEMTYLLLLLPLPSSY